MNLKQFIEKINSYAHDIGCMKDGKMGSHDIVSDIMIEDEDGNSYELKDIELNYLGGCGCPSDITLIIKKGE